MDIPKVIIFDFDGTLADTSTLMRTVYAEMAVGRGWPPITEADYQRLRAMRISQAQRWAGIKTWQIPGLLREGLKRFRMHVGEIELFDQMPEVVKQLADDGYTLYILSTNAGATITEVLDRYQLMPHVTMLKRSALFGKQHAIRHFLSKHKYPPETVCMVGDEVRDVEAAKLTQVKSVAVSWGLQSIEALKAAKPDSIASTPSELLAILKKN